MIAPPTDSLYKFLAISGLAVLAWGVSFPWSKGVEYELKIAETKAEVRKANTKIENLQALYATLGDEEKKLEQQSTAPETRSQLSQIKTKKLATYLEMLEAKLPVDSRVDVLAVMEAALQTYRVVGIASVLLGLALTSTGFFLWYRRVQKYIDDEVQHHQTGGAA